ncbi:hypothetical protein [Nocardia colli]|uniref:hypothetical protein n=1 Tax=Nocardia colli TaxID=2545717 RepID=UPI0035DFE79D
MTTESGSGIQIEFADAWDNPRHTRYIWPAVDINMVLANHYRANMPTRLTRTMLWEAEVRKAWQPDIYLPSVVREDSVQSWSEEATARSEIMARWSEQRCWLAPNNYALVLERAQIDHVRQIITFLGLAEMHGPDSKVISAQPLRQSLFHVEHSVGGSESRPLNQWRVVHLTDRPDDRLVQVSERWSKEPRLGEFLEIYIRRDLRRELTYLD